MRRILPTWMKGIAFVLGVLTLVGLIYGVGGSLTGGGFYKLWRDGSAASWPWWYYVLAVPALGAGALLLEAVGELVGHYFDSRARLRRAIYLAFTIGVTTAFVIFIGWMLWGLISAV